MDAFAISYQMLISIDFILPEYLYFFIVFLGGTYCKFSNRTTIYAYIDVLIGYKYSHNYVNRSRILSQQSLENQTFAQGLRCQLWFDTPSIKYSHLVTFC